MSRSARLVIVVDIADGDVIALGVEQRDAAVAAHPAAHAGTAVPRPLLRHPKAHAVRAAVARIITAAREITACTPS